MSLAEYIIYLGISFYIVLSYQIIDPLVSLLATVAYTLSATSGMLLERCKPRSQRTPAHFYPLFIMLAIDSGDVTYYFQTHIMSEPQRSSKQHFLALHLTMCFTVLTELFYWYGRLYRRHPVIYPEWKISFPFLSAWIYSIDPAAKHFGRRPNYHSDSGWVPKLCEGAFAMTYDLMHWMVNEIICRQVNPGAELELNRALLAGATALRGGVLFDSRHLGTFPARFFSAWIGCILLRPVRVGIALFLAWAAELAEREEQRRWEMRWRRGIGLV